MLTHYTQCQEHNMPNSNTKVAPARYMKVIRSTVSLKVMLIQQNCLRNELVIPSTV